MATFGFDQVHFIIIKSISTATATTGDGVLFSSWCPFCTVIAKGWPILANLGDFVANLSTFWNALSGLNHALVSQNWQISGMHCPSFLFFWSFFLCCRNHDQFVSEVKIGLLYKWKVHWQRFEMVSIDDTSDWLQFWRFCQWLCFISTQTREIALYARNGLFLILKDKRYAATF